jgi:hypothetical protein
MTVLEMLNTLMRTTELINEAITLGDLELLEEMLDERQLTINHLNDMDTSHLTAEENLLAKKILSIEKESDVLLRAALDEIRIELEKESRNRSSLQRKNRVARRYLSDGYMDVYSSSINKKT